MTPQGVSAKLCECGCGKPTPISTKTRPERGYIKGQPQRFICGHTSKGGTAVTKTCDQCGAMFSRSPCRAARAKFCSMRCKSLAMVGKSTVRGVATQSDFLARVDKGDGRGCWLWTGHRGRFGHGRFREKGRWLIAHRRAYELFVGPIPDGLIVRHSCDVPPCVNPAHLLAGTHADNARDCVERGRKAIGSRAGTAKLTEDDVRAIRSLPPTVQLAPIAERYGITQAQVSKIRHRKAWRHVA